MPLVGGGTADDAEERDVVAMPVAESAASRGDVPPGGAHHDGAGVLPLDIRRISALLWLASAVVLGLGIAREFVLHAIGTGTALQDMRQFGLDSEHSLPAWYESLTMAAASALLAVHAVLARGNDPRNRLAWGLLAILFIAMSMDESVAFHEVLIVPLREAFGLTGMFYFSWVVVAVLVLLVLGAIFTPFMVRLPRATAMRFIIAGAMFVAGAFGLELVGGHYASIGGFDYLLYKVAAVCEESLEIAGMTLFVTSLLRHLRDTAPVLRVDTGGRDGR